jgi:hypothetical protein
VTDGIRERFRSILATAIEDAAGERLRETVRRALIRSTIEARREGGTFVERGRMRFGADEFGDRLKYVIAERIRERVAEGLRDRIELAVRDAVEDSLRERLAGVIRRTIAEQRGDGFDPGRLSEAIRYELADSLRTRLGERIRDRVAEPLRARLAEAVESGVSQLAMTY